MTNLNRHISGYQAHAVNATSGAIIVALGAPDHEFRQRDIEALPDAERSFVHISDSHFSSPLQVSYQLEPPTRISSQAEDALGDDGMDRLERFRSLKENWDGKGARTLDKTSVRAFSEFFRDSGLRPDGLAVFMSPSGQLIVNLEDKSNNLVEMEFQQQRLLYFFEDSGEENSVARDDIGVTELYQKLKASAA